MASYTTNLNLKKPAGSENVAIGDINNNMDTIDAAYGTINSTIATIVVSSTETVASKCTRSAPIEIKPGATGAPRSGYGYVGYCFCAGSSFRHIIVSEYSTGNLFFSFGSSIGTTWYQLTYSPYNP